MRLENELRVWKFFSFSWTEIGLSESELQSHVEGLHINQLSINEIKVVLYSQVLWGFAWISLSILFCFIPLVGVLIASRMMPDWEFDNIWLKHKYLHIQKCRWFYVFCPLAWIGWLVGYMVCRRTMKLISSFYVSIK